MSTLTIYCKRCSAPEVIRDQGYTEYSIRIRIVTTRNISIRNGLKYRIRFVHFMKELADTRLFATVWR